MRPIPESELILHPDGSVYHLALLKHQVSDTVILVGDPDRTMHIANYFNDIEFKKHHREFVSCTGYYKNKRLTVISTGIGPDNIDIVLNELDALVNINPITRMPNPNHQTLNIFRLGTCGGIQPHIPINSIIASKHVIGIDGVMHFYDTFKHHDYVALSDAFSHHLQWPRNLATPYSCSASSSLLQRLPANFIQGITVTAPGFYGPQGRVIRLAPSIENLNDKLTTFDFSGEKVLNFEMETSVIYGLSHLLGHNCLTLCVAIANRNSKTFSANYKESVDLLIQNALDFITSNHES